MGVAGKSLTPNRVLLFGDSITASYSFVTSPGVSGSGWYNGARALAAHPFDAVTPINSGAGSDETSDMLTRITTDVYAFSPTVVHVLGGANDVGNSRAAALIQTDLESICDGILADGTADVILGTVYPTSSHQNPTNLAILNTLNASIRVYAAATAGVTLVEFCLAMAADGETLDDAGYVIDGVHPSKSGNAVMAQTLAPILTAVAA